MLVTSPEVTTKAFQILPSTLSALILTKNGLEKVGGGGRPWELEEPNA